MKKLKIELIAKSIILTLYYSLTTLSYYNGEANCRSQDRQQARYPLHVPEHRASGSEGFFELTHPFGRPADSVDLSASISLDCSCEDDPSRCFGRDPQRPSS